MAEKTPTRQATIAGQRFLLRKADVVRAARKLEPEPITSHFAVVGLRRFPPKQLIAAVTNLDRADFTSHQARRTLMRLGFTVGRRDRKRATAGERRRATQGAATPASSLDSFVGQWVAVKDDDVLHAADSPHALVDWLSRHGQKADSMFRVPDDEIAANGLAPL